MGTSGNAEAADAFRLGQTVHRGGVRNHGRVDVPKSLTRSPMLDLTYVCVVRKKKGEELKCSAGTKRGALNICE